MSKRRFMIVCSNKGTRRREGAERGSDQGRREFQVLQEKGCSVAVLAAARKPFGGGRLRFLGGGIDHPFGFIEAEMPGVGVDQVAASAGAGAAGSRRGQGGSSRLRRAGSRCYGGMGRGWNLWEAIRYRSSGMSS